MTKLEELEDIFNVAGAYYAIELKRDMKAEGADYRAARDAYLTELNKQETKDD